MYAASRAPATQGSWVYESAIMEAAPRMRLPTIAGPYPTRERNGAVMNEPTRPPSAETARIAPYPAELSPSVCCANSTRIEKGIM